MSDPKNPNGEDDSDPFHGLPEDPSFSEVPDDEMPAFDDLDESAGTNEALAPEELPPETLPEVVAKKTPKNRRTIILASPGALIVLGLGWLGWSYWVDQEALTTLTADLMAARDRSEDSKGKSEDSGESAAARKLVERAAEMTDAPWWDRVAVKVIDQTRLDGATSEAAELVASAKHRTANRAWWSERMVAAETALAVADRTLPTMQGALDDLHNSQPPFPNDGGFTDEMVTQLSTRIQEDITKLTAMQDASIAQLQQQRLAVQTAATLEDLATATADVAKPLPIDRNPPELSDAVARIGEEAVAVAELLAARNAMQAELQATLTEIQNADMETTLSDSITRTLAALETMSIPSDSRFDAARTLLVQCKENAARVAVVLASRDASMEWVTRRSNELAEIKTLDEIAKFATEISDDDAPPSDLPMVVAALQDLAARIGARAQVLAEEQRLLEASIARAALCDQSFTNANEMMHQGHLADAADEFAAVQPETDDQTVKVQELKSSLSKLLVKRLGEMSEQAKKDGSWSSLAGEFRNCRSNKSIANIAPSFHADSANLWNQVALSEDRMIYADIQRLAHASYAEIIPVANWYLDPARTQGIAAPMQSQVLVLIDSLAVPSVTLQIEGIEWASTNCDWVEAQTAIMIVLDQTFHQFVVGKISADETTLLSDEQQIDAPREKQIQIAVNGQFACSNDDGIFSGSGSLSMDELRAGGRFALPFWNDGDQSLPSHKLLLISIPDDNLRIASDLPPWVELH